MTAPDVGGAVGSAVAVRDAVVLGPPLVQGRAAVHFLHDRTTGAYYRIGAREALIVEGLLDGLDLAGAQDRYRERYGSPVPDDVLVAFLSRMAQRGLLVGASPSVLAGIAERTTAERGRRTLLRARLPVPALGRGVRALAPRLRWTVAPVPLLLGSVLGTVVVAWTLAHLDQILATPRSGPAAVGIAVLLVLSLGVHELFHGVACVRYGGTPREVGVMWRAPIVAAFCSIDDVVVFRRTADRVVTAYAGTYANLVTMPVVWLAWTFTPPGHVLHAVAAGCLLMGSVVVIVNLVPVFGLDGYRMIEHATGTYGLQSSAFAYVGERLRSRCPSLPRRLAGLYWSYAALYTAIVGTGAVVLVVVWWQTLAGLWGPLASTAFLTAEALVVLVLAGWWRSARRRSAAAASPSQVRVS